MQGGGSETRKDELPSFATLVVASSFQIRKMKISARQFGSPSGKRAVRGHVTLYDDVVVLWSPREPSREAGHVFSQDSGRFCGDGKDAQGSVALRRELSTVSGVIGVPSSSPMGSMVGLPTPPNMSQPAGLLRGQFRPLCEESSSLGDTIDKPWAADCGA